VALQVQPVYRGARKRKVGEYSMRLTGRVNLTEQHPRLQKVGGFSMQLAGHVNLTEQHPRLWKVGDSRCYA
jgi:hypothetical protein